MKKETIIGLIISVVVMGVAIFWIVSFTKLLASTTDFANYLTGDEFGKTIIIQKTPAVPLKYITWFFYVCGKYGVDPGLASRIVWCESKWEARAKNPESTAKGLFQITDETFIETMERMELYKDPDLDQFNATLNLELGIFLLSQGEEWRWESSKACWQE